MKKLTIGLMVAGLAVAAAGIGVHAASGATPSVSPASGGPGFAFTVTVPGCVVDESITFAFPPNPPEKVVICAASSPPPPTTLAPTTTLTPTTTVAPTTTAATTTTTTTTTTSTTTTEPDDDCDPIDDETCCDVLEGPFGEDVDQGSEEFDPCLLGFRSGLVLLAQTAAPGTASASFTAPRQPGNYQGTVTSSAGVQPFTVTVVGGQLPATGSELERTLFAVAMLLIAAGGALTLVARSRTPGPADS